jgi:hypothetical protein
MSHCLRRCFDFWVVPGILLVLLGLGISPLLHPAGGGSSNPAAQVSPAATEPPDPEELHEFARNPVQYHLIPRLQGRSLPPASLR